MPTKFGEAEGRMAQKILDQKFSAVPFGSVIAMWCGEPQKSECGPLPPAYVPVKIWVAFTPLSSFFSTK